MGIILGVEIDPEKPTFHDFPDLRLDFESDVRSLASHRAAAAAEPSWRNGHKQRVPGILEDNESLLKGIMMMCLLRTTNESPSTASFYESAVDSPPESSSASTSSSGSSSSDSAASPPQLSPQILDVVKAVEQPLFLDLSARKSSPSDLNIMSPQMALLTPQIIQNISIPSDKPEQPTPNEPDSVEDQQAHQQRKTVPFTFCNMKPNITDLKRRRGRKSVTRDSRQSNVDLRRPSLTVPESVPEIVEIATAIEETTLEKPCPLRRKRKQQRSESLDEDQLSSKSSKVDTCYRRASAPDDHQATEGNIDFEDEIVSISSNPCLSNQDSLSIDDDPKELSSQELVDVVMDGILTDIVSTRSKVVHVPMLDMFKTTPLASFECCGCSKSYSIEDTLCFDLKCQTVLVTCSQCSWWTRRSIQVSHVSF